MKDDIDRFWRVTQELDEATRQECLIDWSTAAVARPEAQEAALALAVALGRCRLFGIEPADEALRGTLLWSMADAALCAACRAAGRLSRDLAHVEDDLLDCDVAIERHSIATGILQHRTDLEGARLIFREAEAEGAADGLSAPPLWHQRRALFEAQLADLDDEISAARDALCIVCETCWPANLASCVHEGVWTPTPWWLTAKCDDVYRANRQFTAALHNAGESLTVHLQLEECIWSQFDDRVEGSPAVPAVELAGPQSDELPTGLQAEPLAMAADAQGPGTLLRPAATFLSVGEDEAAKLELLIHAGWLNTDPRQLPHQISVRAVFRCQDRGRFAGGADAPAIWRMRLGLIVKDLRLERVRDSWVGSAEISASELRHLPRMRIGQRVALRRMG